MNKDFLKLPTEELMEAYHKGLLDSSVSKRQLVAMNDELLRRKRNNPEAYAIYQDLYSSDDPTGIKLTPSWHGSLCAGNGDHGECCCEECDHWPQCFPDWHPGAMWDEENQRFI